MKKNNLQNAAKLWCKTNLKSKNLKFKMFFANTIDEKVRLIENKNCNFFIDDLSSVLKKINNKTHKIWFSNKKKKLFFN